jgi:hypothetical protein
MNQDNTSDKIIQYLAFIFAIITTIIVIILLNGVKNELDIKFIMQNYNIDIGQFVPEKSEKLQYILGTIIFPISYLIYHLALRNVKFHENVDQIYKIILNSGFIFGLFISIIICLNERFYFECFKYLGNTISNIILSIFILYLVVTAVFMYNYLSFIKNIDKMLFIFNIVFIVLVAKLFITNTYYYNNGYVITHFDAYFYPVYKVFSGETLLVDFDNLYGFYPYLLAPVFRLIGGLTMLRFSIVMAGLVFIALTSIAFTTYRVIQNKVLAFVGNLAFDFVIIVYGMTYQGGDYYLQYYPHRLLFPMMIISLCVLIVQAKSYKTSRIYEIIGYVLCTLSLLWNIDTGIVVVVAFSAFNLYRLFIKYELTEKKIWLGIIKNLILTFSSIMCMILSIYLITYIRTGVLIKLIDLFYGQISFYGLGFAMIRMPLIHPWILLVSIYAVALVKAIRKIKFIKSEKSTLSELHISLYFLLPIIGMGIFSYFQGRSHLHTFIPVTWPGIIILILFIQEYIDEFKKFKFQDNKKNKIMVGLKAVLIMLLIGNYAFALIVNLVVPSRLIDAKNNIKSMHATYITPIIDEVNNIRVGDENIDIIAYNSAAIYCTLGETDIANVPASIDWFTKKDYQRVLDWIATTNNKVIFDRTSYNHLLTYSNEEMLLILQRFRLINDTPTYLSFQVIG